MNKRQLEKKKRELPGFGDESEARHMNRFQKAMADTLPLVSPDQLRKILVRLSYKPSPADVFGSEDVPKRLNDLHFEAVVAVQRYCAELAHRVLLKEPIPESGPAYVAGDRI